MAFKEGDVVLVIYPGFGWWPAKVNTVDTRNTVDTHTVDTRNTVDTHICLHNQ